LFLPSFPDQACFAAVLSKVLSIVIIAGACAVKLPQVLKLINAGSAQGLSPSGMYFETVSVGGASAFVTFIFVLCTLRTQIARSICNTIQ
jgi:hypothetical protein